MARSMQDTDSLGSFIQRSAWRNCLENRKSCESGPRKPPQKASVESISHLLAAKTHIREVSGYFPNSFGRVILRRSQAWRSKKCASVRRDARRVQSTPVLSLAMGAIHARTRNRLAADVPPGHSALDPKRLPRHRGEARTSGGRRGAA